MKARCSSSYNKSKKKKFRNKNVLRVDLKDERDVVFLIESSRLLHNIDAEKEKARSPYVTELTVWSVKTSLECRIRYRYYCSRRDDKQAGQSPSKILKVLINVY